MGSAEEAQESSTSGAVPPGKGGCCHPERTESFAERGSNGPLQQGTASQSQRSSSSKPVASEAVQPPATATTAAI
jgi:hypothetical protein